MSFPFAVGEEIVTRASLSLLDYGIIGAVLFFVLLFAVYIVKRHLDARENDLVYTRAQLERMHAKCEETLSKIMDKHEEVVNKLIEAHKDDMAMIKEEHQRANHAILEKLVQRK
jgi:hypothetical protein